jgi:hypothetical protein
VGTTVHYESWPVFYSFLTLQAVSRTPWAGHQPAARPLPIEDTIYTSCGIRTNDPSIYEGEDSSCLRPCGYCDRQGKIHKLQKEIITVALSRATAQAVSPWPPTAAARVLKPGLVMWDLWWTKWRWGSFYQSTSVSPANLHSTNFSIITITYHPGLVQQASSGRSTKRPTAQIKKKNYVALVWKRNVPT